MMLWCSVSSPLEHWFHCILSHLFSAFLLFSSTYETLLLLFTSRAPLLLSIFLSGGNPQPGGGGGQSMQLITFDSILKHQWQSGLVMWTRTFFENIDTRRVLEWYRLEFDFFTSLTRTNILRDFSIEPRLVVYYYIGEKVAKGCSLFIDPERFMRGRVDWRKEGQSFYLALYNCSNLFAHFLICTFVVWPRNYASHCFFLHRLVVVRV